MVVSTASRFTIYSPSRVGSLLRARPPASLVHHPSSTICTASLPCVSALRGALVSTRLVSTVRPPAPRTRARASIDSSSMPHVREPTIHAVSQQLAQPRGTDAPAPAHRPGPAAPTPTRTTCTCTCTCYMYSVHTRAHTFSLSPPRSPLAVQAALGSRHLDHQTFSSRVARCAGNALNSIHNPARLLTT